MAAERASGQPITLPQGVEDIEAAWPFERDTFKGHKAWDDFLTTLAERTEPIEPEPVEPEFAAIGDYLANVPTEIPWIIEGFLYEGGSTLTSGPPKGGKSTLAAAVMASLETGSPFLGRPVTPRPIALLTEEGGVPVRFKYGNLATLEVFDRQMAHGEPFAQTLRRIDAWAQRHPGGVLFVDTLSVWAGIDDENDAAKVTAAMDAINVVRDRNRIAIALIHHSRKGGGKDGEAIRGSGALLATVDHVVEVRRHDTVRTQRYLDLMGRVLSEQMTVLVDFDPATRTYAEVDLAEDRLDEIEELLKPLPVKGMDAEGATYQGLVTAWGCSRTTALRKAEYLLSVGRLSEGETRVHGVRAKVFWAIPAAPLNAKDWTSDDE